MLGEHPVVDRRHAGDHAAPAGLGAVHAQQADRVAVVGVRVEPLGGDVAAQIGIVEVRDLQVGDLLEHRALDVLRHDPAEVAAEAPVQRLDLVGCVARDGDAAHQHEAAALAQLRIDPPQALAHHGQREVLGLEPAPGEPARLDRPQRAVDVLEVIRSQLVYPAAGRAERVAGPGARVNGGRAGGLRHRRPRSGGILKADVNVNIRAVASVPTGFPDRVRGRVAQVVPRWASRKPRSCRDGPSDGSRIRSIRRSAASLPICSRGVTMVVMPDGKTCPFIS